MMNSIKKIIIYGDSILKGVVLNAENGKYQQLSESSVIEVERTLGIEIENFSLFGMTTPKAYHRFFEQNKDFSHAAVLLEYGGNDCNFDWRDVARTPHEPHDAVTNLTVYEDYLTKMIHFIRKNKGTPLLMTLPPLQAEWFLNWVTRDGTSRENILIWLGDAEHIYRWQESYNLALIRVALRTRTPIIDARAMFLACNTYQNYLCIDGMHLNDKGHRLLADMLIRYANQHKRRLTDIFLSPKTI